jgi:hypothetical protein
MGQPNDDDEHTISDDLCLDKHNIDIIEVWLKHCDLKFVINLMILSIRHHIKVQVLLLNIHYK